MLILLIGPKGSGKSHIGRLLESALGVHFFHVEPLWMAYYADCRSTGREPAIAEGIRYVQPALAAALQQHTHVCVETTGASAEILDHLLSLAASGQRLLVKVAAPWEVCVRRIRTRDPAHQIPLDWETIRKVHDLSQALELPFDIVLDNTSLAPGEILEPFVRALQVHNPAEREVSTMERVTSADGTQIAVRRSGSGPPLVLVHGTTADHTRWAQVLPGFEQHFTVYAMDRRGRGASGDGDAYAIAREGEDVAAVVDWIGEPVNLLGHSYGAICCLEAALRTDRLRRMVLYEPPIPVGREIVPAQTRARLEELLQQNEREAALLTFFREVVRVPADQLEKMRAHPAWPGRVAAAHTVVREISFEAEYRLDFGRLRSVQTPTLLLLGGDSPEFFHEATRRLDAALPNSRIHELPNQQHVAMDMIPDEFVAIVREFLLA